MPGFLPVSRGHIFLVLMTSTKNVTKFPTKQQLHGSIPPNNIDFTQACFGRHRWKEK